MARLEHQTEGTAAVIREIAEGQRLVLGRGEDAGWRVAAEPMLSRKHAEVWLECGRLRVSRLPGAVNPIYHGGAVQDEFTVEPGDFFVIGKTRFWLAVESLSAASEPIRGEPQTQETLGEAELYSPGAAADSLRLHDLLELPEILRSRDRKDFYLHIASLLRLATNAGWSCVVLEDGSPLGEDASDDIARRPALSRTLLDKALAGAPQPTLYCWSRQADFAATAAAGVDWAICAAARIAGEPPLVFYVCGAAGPSSASLRANARFVGLVADMVSRSMSNEHLQDWQGRLRRFFAGPVIDKIMASQDLRALEPRLAQSTVMFFDIRGFSKRTEEKGERVLAYVTELRRVMTAMTEIILEEHGVVLQYLGDGILACWNVPFDDEGHVDRACRAALSMARGIGHAADGWSCGIGIHTGEVVAGAIGSDQVFSYSIIGTVVNQASRIEGLTKILGVSILVTGDVAARTSRRAARPARMGRFIPAGMSNPLELYALREPDSDPACDRAFAGAWESFERGDWDKVLGLAAGLPADYGPGRFLIAQVLENLRCPPVSWQGTVKIDQK